MQAGTVASASEYSALLELGLTMVHTEQAKNHPIRWSGYLKQIKIDEFTRDDRYFTGFMPMPEKDVGGPFVLDKPHLSDRKVGDLVTYGLGFVAEYELGRWNKYKNTFAGISKQLSQAGLYTKNVLGFSIFNRAFDATAPSEYKIFNGEVLCKVDHVLERPTTVVGKNAPATPTDLNYLALQEGMTDFMNVVNEDGLFVQLEPECLLTSTTQHWVARTLLESDYRSDNANMAKNTVGGGALKAETAPFLTNPNAWFLIASKDGPWGDSVQYEIGDDLQPRRDFQISTLNTVLSMYMSCRLWLMHWKGIWGSEGS